MNPEPARPAPTRTIITILLALFAAVLIVQLIVGLPQFVFYGLIGGLVFCMIIVGRDRLLAAQRMMEPPPTQAPPPDDEQR
jgi:purine-cytosine permease-like protein